MARDWVAQEAGRLQELVVTDIAGWVKNEKSHFTPFGYCKPDYMPCHGDKGRWINADRPEAAEFIADSKYLARPVGLDNQMRGFFELAASTRRKTLILFTQDAAAIRQTVVAAAQQRGVRIVHLKQHRSR
jgi:hypothetical protein